MMELDKAIWIAGEIMDELRPSCERVAVAGSVRRGNPEVKDIEIVVEPFSNVVKVDIFGTKEYQYNIDIIEEELLQLGDLIKNGNKYKQCRLRQGINLDLFIVTYPAQWGVIYTIRTGPPEFSHWIVTPRNKGGALPSYARVKDGAVWTGGTMIQMSEEKDFFDFLNMAMIPPRNRKPWWGARVVGS
jgi:DNA polymerase/3'-5' exonuclease PolX